MKVQVRYRPLQYPGQIRSTNGPWIVLVNGHVYYRRHTWAEAIVLAFREAARLAVKV